MAYLKLISTTSSGHTEENYNSFSQNVGKRRHLLNWNSGCYFYVNRFIESARVMSI